MILILLTMAVIINWIWTLLVIRSYSKLDNKFMELDVRVKSINTELNSLRQKMLDCPTKTLPVGNYGSSQ